MKNYKGRKCGIFQKQLVFLQFFLNQINLKNFSNPMWLLEALQMRYFKVTLGSDFIKSGLFSCQKINFCWEHAKQMICHLFAMPTKDAFYCSQRSFMQENWMGFVKVNRWGGHISSHPPNVSCLFKTQTVPAVKRQKNVFFYHGFSLMFCTNICVCSLLIVLY